MANPASTTAPEPESSTFGDLIGDATGLAPDGAKDRTVKTPVEDTPPPAKEPETPAAKEPAPAKVDEPKKEPAKKEPATKTAESDDDLNPNLAAQPKKEDPVAKKTTEEEMPGGMTKKAQDTWKSIKQSEEKAQSELSTAVSELTAVKQQLEESKKTASEIDRLKKELDAANEKLSQYDDEISVTRVESTKEFKSQVTEPLKAINATVKTLAEKYEVNVRELQAAIEEPDASKRADAIEELTADFKGYDRSEIFEAAKAHAKAAQVAETLRTGAKERLEEIERRSAQEREGEDKKALSEFRNSVNGTWEGIQDEFPLLRPVPGHDKWNQRLDGILRKVEEINVNEIPIPEVAKMAVSFHVVPELKKALSYLQKQDADQKTEIASLKERLAEMRSTVPGAGDGSTRTDAPSAPGGGEGGFADSILAPR